MELVKLANRINASWLIDVMHQWVARCGQYSKKCASVEPDFTKTFERLFVNSLSIPLWGVMSHDRLNALKNSRILGTYIYLEHK